MISKDTEISGLDQATQIQVLDLKIKSLNKDIKVLEVLVLGALEHEKIYFSETFADLEKNKADKKDVNGVSDVLVEAIRLTKIELLKRIEKLEQPKEVSKEVSSTSLLENIIKLFK